MRRTISSGSPMEAVAAYSRAVVQNGFVFVSGTMGVDPETRELPEDFTAQVGNAFIIIGKALAEAGSSFAQVAHVKLFVSERSDIPAIIPFLQDHFGDVRPAQTMVIAQMPDPRAKIEIEVVAAVG